MNRRGALGAVAALLLLFPPALLGEPPSRGEFGEQLTVSVVQVPVQVFRDGEPVAGLTEEDFEVYDEGTRRELSSFEVVDLTVSNVERPAAVTPSTTSGRNLLVLFDFAYTPPPQLVRSARHLERMVEGQLHPADRVALAVYSHGRGAQLLLGFTSNRAEILAGLELLARMVAGRSGEVKVPPALAKALERRPVAGDPTAELARLSSRLGPAAALALSSKAPESKPLFTGVTLWGLPTLGMSAVGEDGEEAARPPGPVSSVSFTSATALGGSFEDQAERRSALTLARRMAESLAELATLLRSVGGQKHMLYLSRGFSSQLLEEQVTGQFSSGLFEAFRRTGWQIQALDPGGVPDPFGGGLHELGSPEPGPSSTVGFRSDSLLYLAQGTGGEVYENFNDLGLATERVLDKTRLTYVLSFSVADLPADGKYRKLEVRLRDGLRGTKLVYREGYYAGKPERDKNELERQLDSAERLLGAEEGGTLEVTAAAFPLRPAGAQAPVPFFVEVTGSSLGAISAAERRTIRVRAYALAGVEALSGGTLSGALSHEMGVDLQQAEPALSSHGLRFYGAVVAPPGELRLRLSVEDVEGGRSWLGTIPLRVPDAGEETYLAPPFFLDLEGGWFVTRYDAGSASVLYPFKVGERDVVPSVHPRLVPGQKRAVLLLLQGDVQDDLGVSARVLSAEGTPVQGGAFEVLTREARGAGDIQRLVASFSPTGLPPGEYRLEVTLAGKDGKAKAKSEAGFAVGE